MTDLAATPRIAAQYRMQFEPAQDSWVLLYPEGLVQLNLPAAEILKRCDGQRSVAEVIEDVQRAFQRDDLKDEVLAFMSDAYARGWLIDARGS